MAIHFVPPRGRILICNYDLARIHPEIDKQRRTVVVSPRSYNRRHGNGHGRCVVVPFSATEPNNLTPAFVEFPSDKYKSLTERTWLVCESIASVSHFRLSQVYSSGQPINENLDDDDMARVLTGISHLFGIA